MSNNPFDDDVQASGSNNPFDDDPTPKKRETTKWEDFKIGAAGGLEALNTGVSMATHGAVGAVRDAIGNPISPEVSDKYFRDMEARNKSLQQWSNPDEAEQGLGGKVFGTLTSLPAQIVGLPGQSAVRGKNMIDNGESVEDAISASLADTALNVASVAAPAAWGRGLLPKMATGAAANVATGAASDAFTQIVGKTQATKDMYDPLDVDNRVVEAIVGAAIGPLGGTGGKKPPKANDAPKVGDKAKEILEKKKKAQEQGELPPDRPDATPPDQGPLGETPENLALYKRMAERQHQTLRNAEIARRRDEAGGTLEERDTPFFIDSEGVAHTKPSEPKPGEQLEMSLDPYREGGDLLANRADTGNFPLPEAPEAPKPLQTQDALPLDPRREGGDMFAQRADDGAFPPLREPTGEQLGPLQLGDHNILGDGKQGEMFGGVSQAFIQSQKGQRGFMNIFGKKVEQGKTRGSRHVDNFNSPYGKRDGIRTEHQANQALTKELKANGVSNTSIQTLRKVAQETSKCAK